MHTHIYIFFKWSICKTFGYQEIRTHWVKWLPNSFIFALIFYQKTLWSFWDDEEKQKDLGPKMKLSLNLRAISYSIFEICWLRDGNGSLKKELEWFVAIYKKVEKDIQNIFVQFTFHVLFKRKEKKILWKRMEHSNMVNSCTILSSNLSVSENVEIHGLDGKNGSFFFSV